MSAPRWSVGVVVPARDEDDRIEACLTSIERSLAATPGIVGHLVVVADACDDRTAEVAERTLLGSGEVVAAHLGNVGAARRLGTARALRRLAQAAEGHGRGLDARRTWLLTTDADTVVPEGWVASHLRLADAGAAAVAGIVRLGLPDDVETPATLREAFDRGYPLHPDGTHPHVHGANLGVRADAYRAVGGWAGLATAEDHALWDRLRAHGWPTVSAIDPWVATSARLVGRAPAGFAGHLAGLAPGPGAVEPEPVS